MEKPFSIVEALRFGFYLTVENLPFFMGILVTFIGILVGVFLLVGALFFLPSLFKLFPFLKEVQLKNFTSGEVFFALKYLSPFISLGMIFAFLMLKLIQVFLNLGFVKVCLDFYDYKFGTFSSLFSCAHLTLKGFVASLLYGLIVSVGLFLLVIPGIIWAIQFSFYQPFLVDKNTSIIRAFKNSSLITHGRKWHLFSFYFVLFLINALAVSFFGIGLIITIPASMLAITYVYRHLFALPAEV